MHIEKLMETTSNVKRNKAIKETVEQMTEPATETKSHEITLTGSNVNMSTKSVVKIATISHATVPDENHAVPPTFGTSKNSAPLPTIVFGVVFLNNLLIFLCFAFVDHTLND